MIYSNLLKRIFNGCKDDYDDLLKRDKKYDLLIQSKVWSFVPPSAIKNKQHNWPFCAPKSSPPICPLSLGPWLFCHRAVRPRYRRHPRSRTLLLVPFSRLGAHLCWGKVVLFSGVYGHFSPSVLIWIPKSFFSASWRDRCMVGMYGTLQFYIRIKL